MKVITRFSIAAIAGIALTGALSLAPRPGVMPAKANVTVMCAPQLADTAAARTIGGASSSVPSKTVYSLNGQGCANIQQGDVNYFLSQGFSAGPPFGANILFTTGVWTGTTSFQAGVLPPNTYIQHLICQETAGNTVTGGVNVGTTSGGSDIAGGANFACTASALGFVKDANIAKRIFSTTAGQPIFVTPLTAGNNANVTFTVVYGYF